MTGCKKKSVLPIYTVALVWVLFTLFHSLSSVSDYVSVILLSALGFIIARGIWPAAEDTAPDGTLSETETSETEASPSDGSPVPEAPTTEDHLRFFKKTGVAVVLAVLVVALCCVWGYSRTGTERQPQGGTHTTEHKTAGENTLNYFLNLVEDEAELFSLSTRDALAQENLTFADTYDSVVAIQTVSYLNGRDIDQYAREQFDSFHKTGLSDMDMLLVLSDFDADWYLVYGSGIRSAVESDKTLPNLFSAAMKEGFFTGEANARILSLYTELEDWYADHITPIPQTEGNQLLQGGDKVQSVTLTGIVNGVLLTLLANVWWILILLLIFNAVDRARYTRFRSQPPQSGAETPHAFRPLLFWHQAGSRWFRRMEAQSGETENPDGFDSTGQRQDSDSDDSGGFGRL